MMDISDENDENMLDTVRRLGPQLTNPDHELRLQGLLCLERKILRTSVTDMHPGEVTSLVEFLIGKLGDHHSLCSPSLRCLRYLTTSPNLIFEDAIIICQTIFSEIQTQALNQLDRQSVFSILSNLLTNFCDELAEKMSHDFVFGFIQAIEGEKDPRNLIIVFRLAETVIKRFNIERFTEDLFEIVSCYYPVVFVPPPNDSRGITREQLVLLNRSCLTASPAFAPFLLPILLEKFQESAPQTRLEAFQTLSDAVHSYPLRDLKTYELSLTDCLQKELTKDMSSEMEQAVHQCGINLARAFSAHKVDDADEDLPPFQHFVSSVFKAASEEIIQEEGPRCRATGRYLLAIAGSGLAAMEHLCIHLLPFLLDLKKNEPFICQLLDIARAMGWNRHAEHLAELRTMLDFKEPFPSVKLLLRLIFIPHFLSEEQTTIIVNEAMNWVCQTSEESARDDTVKVLAEVACSCSTKQDGMEVCESDSSGQQFFDDWKRMFLDDEIEFVRRQTVLLVLQSCAKFSTEKCTHLVRWLFSSFHLSHGDTSLMIELLTAILCDITDSNLVSVLVKDLVAFLESVNAAQWRQISTALKPPVMHLIRLGSSVDQKSLLNVCLQRVKNEKDSRQSSINLLCSVVCSLSSDVVETCEATELLVLLLELSAVSEDASHAYASLLNKTVASDDVFAVFSSHLQGLEWSFASEQTHLWFVLTTRALLTRNHPRSVGMLHELLGLLEGERQELAAWTAQRTDLLVKSLPDTFHRGTHFTLALQKTFVLVHGRLGPKCASLTGERRDLHIGALVLILAHLPPQILLQHAEAILTLLVRGLLLPSPEVPQASLQVLQSLCELPAVSEAIAAHADDFLPAVLSMMKAETTPMVSRADAARLLRALLPRLPEVCLRTHRPMILRQLACAVNDRKRLVRKEAAAARNVWLESAGVEQSAK